MSSYYYHSEKREQRYTQNPIPNIGIGSGISVVPRILPPVGMFSPAIYGGPLINDVGNGQQSSYSVQYYTYPGSISYYERIG